MLSFVFQILAEPPNTWPPNELVLGLAEAKHLISLFCNIPSSSLTLKADKSASCSNKISHLSNNFLAVFYLHKMIDTQSICQFFQDLG